MATISLIYVLLYGAIGSLYLAEGMATTLYIRKLINMHLVTIEQALLTYLITASMGCMLMAARAVINTTIACDRVTITIVRVMSYLLILVALHLGNRLLWKTRIEGRYLTWE